MNTTTISLDSGVSKNPLPPKLYRGLLMLTSSWVGERVNEKSLLIKVHDVPNATRLPLIWCGGPPEMGTIINICGKDRAIYGLRGTYDFVEPTHDVITALSQYYADEIERTIPSQTYLIAGYCAAAYISIEVANLLMQRGYKIGFLGLVDRDVTEKTRLLRVFRKLFDWADRLGARAYAFKDAIKHQDTQFKVANAIKAVTRNPEKVINDPRNQIKYVKKPAEAMYELKPYQGKVNLFFIRWGVFGYYQLDFFRHYWRKIAKGGLQVEFVPGYSHKYPSWPNIIRMLHHRLNETGY